jgi:hypothetical protein
MRLLLLLSFSLCISCQPTEDIEEPVAPDDFDGQASYDAAVSRLMAFERDGWIVSLKDGQPEHQGDSLLWTGIALGVLPCDKAEIFADALRSMLVDNSGYLVRYMPLPEEYMGGREVSFDGATGFYYGLAANLVRCGSADSWRDYWSLHNRRLPILHPNTPGVDVVPEFTVLQDYISHLLGQRGKPHKDRVRILEKEIELWARAVVLQRASCYRIHLGWLYLRSMESLNVLSAKGKYKFCDATDGVGIPLIDHWCGRSHIAEWNYVENDWEYRHQRCGAWETPDGKPGLETPGLDAVIAYSLTL